MQHLYTSCISHCCPNCLQYLDVHIYIWQKIMQSRMTHPWRSIKLAFSFRIMQSMKMPNLVLEFSIIISRTLQYSKINKISHEEQLPSLCALLSENQPMSNYVTLPANADVVNLLSSSPYSCIENEILFRMKFYYLGHWRKYQYIVYSHMYKDDGTYVMDLHRVENCSDFN